MLFSPFISPSPSSPTPLSINLFSNLLFFQGHQSHLIRALFQRPHFNLTASSRPCLQTQSHLGGLGVLDISVWIWGAQFSLSPKKREVWELTLCVLVAQSCPTLRSRGLQPTRLLSMGFSRQRYWSGLPFPAPGDFPDPGIEPGSPALQADSLLTDPPGEAWELTVRGQNFLMGGRCL